MSNSNSSTFLSKNKPIEKSKILGKGGFGCALYKPEIECSTKSNFNTSVLEVPIKYINKIQVLKENEYLFLQKNIDKKLDKEELSKEELSKQEELDKESEDKEEELAKEEELDKESEAKEEELDKESEAKEEELIKDDEIPIIENRLSSVGRGPLTEVYFGKIIQTIPNYYMYFVPVIGYCFFDIKKLSPVEKSSCFETNDDKITPNFENKNFLNTKSQYIEGGSLFNYFKSLSGNTNDHLVRTINSTQTGGVSNDITGTKSFKHTIIQSSPTPTQDIPPIFIEKFIQTYYFRYW